MEIQVGFDQLQSYLSYNCSSKVRIGDLVLITSGVRDGMIGKVVALKRGSYRGPLCTCEIYTGDSGRYYDRQDPAVKRRL